MIKPDELESKAGQLTWDTIVAAAEGDVIALRQLLKQNPRLALSEYWYTPAIHFAVREGHIEAVELLLDAGASPLHRAVRGGSTETIALLLDRGANVHAFQGAPRGLANGQWWDIQAIDLAIWCGGGPAGGSQIARLLVMRGATYDLQRFPFECVDCMTLETAANVA